MLDCSEGQCFDPAPAPRRRSPPGRLLVNECVEHIVIKESHSSTLIPGDPSSDARAEAIWFRLFWELFEILQGAWSAVRIIRPSPTSASSA